MNENEILEHMALHGDRVWSNLQFWTSVSFGLLIAAHIAAANVSKSVLAAILVLYMFFTATFMGMVLYDIEVIRAGGMQLKMLADAGAQLSLISQATLDHGPVLNDSWYKSIVRQGMAVGLFLVTLLYPIHCYRKRRP